MIFKKFFIKQMSKSISFDDYFMHIAETVKLKSPDYTKVGAVLVSLENKVISTGYNKIPDNCKIVIDWDNREEVSKYIIHAEVDALLYANSRFDNSIMYITRSPCKKCIKFLAACNVKEVIYKLEHKDFEEMNIICKNLDIKLRLANSC